jgi:hypothetical protein
MKFYESEATIAAAPDAVWSILTDGARYPTWDSGVERVVGSIATGERIKVHSEVSPGRAFPVKVVLSPDRRSMTWNGGLPLGLFRGVRTFTLTPDGNAGTHFRMREEYSGPFLGVMWKSMPDLGPSIAQFAAGLKTQAEQANRQA